jgi:chemotaxis protein methyltransferase CheR
LEKAVEAREKIEIELLLEGIYRMYGYDFRNYAYDSIRRRIWHSIHTLNLQTITGLLDKVMHQPKQMQALLSSLMIHVTEMYRDPALFKTFRCKVIPFLSTYPFIRIWHAGCSTGEEALSMAILLQEEELYERSRIYATDIQEDVLEKAQSASFPVRNMQKYTHNYLQAGGKGFFSDYYTATYDAAVFNAALLRNMTFARHNLVTDQSFNEFNVIFCRNVLIYFNKSLQRQVHRLFYESLSMFGVLVLGDRETLQFSEYADCYETLDKQQKIYRKIK